MEKFEKYQSLSFDKRKKLIQKYIIAIAVDLYKNGETMRADELCQMVNQEFVGLFPNKYKNLGPVITAAHRNNENLQEKEALENVFTNHLGKPLVCKHK